MILMDEMIPMKLYSGKLKAYLPFDPVNKKKGATITLLTKSVQDSIELMNTPFFVNPSYFTAYYMDRNVKRYFTSSGEIEVEADDEEEESIEEAVMYKKDQKSPKVVSYGSSADLRAMEKIFTKKNFDKWFEFFHIRESQ